MIVQNINAQAPFTTKDGVVQTPGSVSQDGKWLLFGEGGIAADAGTWLLPLPTSAGAGS